MVEVGDGGRETHPLCETRRTCIHGFGISHRLVENVVEEVIFVVTIKWWLLHGETEREREREIGMG